MIIFSGMSERTSKPAVRFLPSIPALVLVGLAVFSIALAETGSTYNLIQDNTFEENSPLWVQFQNTDETNVSRHAPGGYEKSAGMIDLRTGLEDAPPELLRFGYLSQDLSKRNISEIDSVYWFVKYLPARIETSAAPYWFGVIISGYAEPRGMCELKYFYRHESAQLPAESDHEKNIALTLPPSDSFYRHGRNFNEDWRQAGFSPTAEILKMKLIAGSVKDPVGAAAGGYGQTVWFDNLNVHSSRFDHDVAAEAVISGTKIKIGRSYVPQAKVGNRGVYKETFRVACTIFKGDLSVYADTVTSIMLKNVPVDQAREVEWKRWVPHESGSYSIKISTMLKGDQNSSNDTIKQELIFVEE